MFFFVPWSNKLLISSEKFILPILSESLFFLTFAFYMKIFLGIEKPNISKPF